MDISAVAKYVRENCSIADSKNWGSYSLCILLIRMRDLYRWENSINPWERIDNDELMEWVSVRESAWQKGAGRKFKDIEIEGKKFSPFDPEKINRLLTPHGFIYGAGYVGALRPSFFLAELEELRREGIYNIYIAGKELARDLVTSPAMSQGNNIFARKEPAVSILWGRVEEYRSTGSKFIKFAFEDYGLDVGAVGKNVIRKMEGIASKELESYIHHEIGELSDAIFPDKIWRELIVRFPQTNIEALARSIKDILADTCDKGMLRHIVKNKKTGSLGFYVSMLSGFRRPLFPEIKEAYTRVRKTGDWSAVERLRKRKYKKVKGHAERVVRIARKGKTRGRKWIKKEIESELIASLTW